jgi:uncharacterized protein (DUF58 family)
MNNGLSRVDRSLVIYALIATIIYVGVYANNYTLTLTGVSLFLIFTSYLLTWDLLINVVFSSLKLHSEVVTVGNHVIIRINAYSSLALRIPMEMDLICSPHLKCGAVNDIVINGALVNIDIEARWSGIAKILGAIIRVSEPMGVVVRSAFVKLGYDIAIEPMGQTTRLLPGRRFARDLSGVSLHQTKYGDFLGLKNYDFLEPASSIHWMTSARVGELISTARSEAGSTPSLVIMEYTPRMLKPVDDYRPIDRALMILRHLKGDFALLLVGNGLVRFVKPSQFTSLVNLELRLRVFVMRMESKESIIRRARDVIGRFADGLDDYDLMTWLYPISIDKGLSKYDIETLTKYLRKDSLLIITRESFNELLRSNVDLSRVHVVIIDEGSGET